MIKDKKYKAEVAESKEEALWYKVAEARKKSIESLKESLIIEEAFLKMAEKKLKNLNERGDKSRKDNRTNPRNA